MSLVIPRLFWLRPTMRGDDKVDGERISIKDKERPRPTSFRWPNIAYLLEVSLQLRRQTGGNFGKPRRVGEEDGRKSVLQSQQL